MIVVMGFARRAWRHLRRPEIYLGFLLVGSLQAVGLGSIFFGRETFVFTASVLGVANAAMAVTCLRVGVGLEGMCGVRLLSFISFVLFWSYWYLLFMLAPPESGSPLEYQFGHGLFMTMLPGLVPFLMGGRIDVPLAFRWAKIFLGLFLGFCVFMYITGQTRVYAGRISFTHGVDSIRMARLGGMALLIVFVDMFYGGRWRPFMPRLALSGFGGIVIILGNSRGPFFALTAAMSMFVFYLARRGIAFSRVSLASVSAVGLAAFIGVMAAAEVVADLSRQSGYNVGRLFTLTFSSGSTESIRLDHFNEYLSRAEMAPITGIGYGSASIWAHNIFIESLGIGGIALLAMLLVWILSFVAQALRFKDSNQVCLACVAMYGFIGANFSGSIALEHIPWVAASMAINCGGGKQSANRIDPINPSDIDR